MTGRRRVTVRGLMLVVAGVAVFLGGVEAGRRWERSHKTPSVTTPKASSPTPPGVVTWYPDGGGVAYGHYKDRRGRVHTGMVITITKEGSIITD